MKKKKRKRLFYDIETSFCEGTFWRPGYNQTINPSQILRYGQIICISWKWEGQKRVKHIDWGLNEQCDKALLEVFIKELDKADQIVAHNGDRFDIKWIRARAAFHGLDMRHSYNSVDTYKLSKKFFALPSYKLSEVAKYFGLVAKLDSGGLETWINVIINKSAAALKKMIWYCDGDINTLEAVFNFIRSYTQSSLNYSVLHGGAKYGCPECGGLPKHNKMYTTAQGTIQHYMKCRDAICKTLFKINNKAYQEYLTYKMLNSEN